MVNDIQFSTVLINMMFLRFHLLLRLISNTSKWTNVESEDSCEAEGFEADFYFAFKSLLKDKPYQMLFLNFLLSILTFGLSVRSFER
jgi:hypothetical protein